MTIEERGTAIYESRLKDTLERDHLGKAVAIHLDTGDYAVDRRWTTAARKLREKHPDGETLIRFIGPPTSNEITLAMRLRDSEKGSEKAGEVEP